MYHKLTKTNIVFCLLLWLILTTPCFGGTFFGKLLYACGAFKNSRVEETLELSLAHLISCGRNVVVVDVDSGANYELPELKNHLMLSIAYDFGDSDSDVMDLYGHGTAVASIIAKVAPCAKIVPIKINPGGENYFDSEALKEALEYLVNLISNHPEIKVVNLSLGLEKDPEIDRLINTLWSKGVVVTAAAGNEALSKVDFPASSSKALAISGTSGNGLYHLSNTGKKVFVSAPAENIEALYPSGFVGLVEGTSFSSAIAAGVAALLAEKGLSPLEIKLYLARGSTDLGYPGYDEMFGFGRVNAFESLIEAISGSYRLVPKRVSMAPSDTVKIHLAGDTGVSGFFATRSLKLNSSDTQVSISENQTGSYWLYGYSQNPLKLARSRVDVTESPKATLELSFPPKLEKGAEECLFIYSPVAKAYSFFLKTTEESADGSFNTSTRNLFTFSLPKGEIYSCWNSKHEEPEIVKEILLCSYGAVCNRSVYLGAR